MIVNKAPRFIGCVSLVFVNESSGVYNEVRMANEWKEKREGLH